jgi:Protein of unknown function (DUF3077)
MLKSENGEFAGFVTTRLPFFRCGVEGQEHHLFEVVAGVPIAQALEQATCILLAARKTSLQMIENQELEQEMQWAVYGQMEMARALVTSVFEAVKD